MFRRDHNTHINSLGPNESHLAVLFGFPPNKKVNFKIGGKNVSLDFVHKNTTKMATGHTSFKFKANHFPNNTNNNPSTTTDTKKQTKETNILNQIKENSYNNVFMNPVDEDINQTPISQDFYFNSPSSKPQPPPPPPQLNPSPKQVYKETQKQIHNIGSINKIPKSPTKPKLPILSKTISKPVNNNNNTKTISNQLPIKNNLKLKLNRNNNFKSNDNNNNQKEEDITFSFTSISSLGFEYQNNTNNNYSGGDARIEDLEDEVLIPSLYGTDRKFSIPNSNTTKSHSFYNFDVSTPYDYIFNVGNESAIASTKINGDAQTNSSHPIQIPSSVPQSHTIVIDDSSPCHYHDLQTQYQKSNSSLTASLTEINGERVKEIIEINSQTQTKQQQHIDLQTQHHNEEKEKELEFNIKDNKDIDLSYPPSCGQPLG
ncbi:putative C-module-binding factor [Tieghemostelium lacteum]|uniref:Putative C-module-binding factor n=1 Tax=Tieghemostelium lacteum TaxID=361077 RepID=A0A152A788_TIELA|nr:putative C-module-binding factor [Tieghemostelium lacteum]|eukprot:KYR02088.1 putative C-module-binding factor [Tieghemostelium lacteum]